jgi:hypothetical protein
VSSIARKTELRCCDWIGRSSKRCRVGPHLIGTISASDPVSKRGELAARIRAMEYGIGMKFVAVALAFVSVAAASAQISAAEQPIEDAFVQLRQESQIMLELDGTDQYGPKTTTLYANAFFDWDPINVNKFAKAEVNDFFDGIHAHRIVGDGTTLWGYDFTRNAYTSLRYGSYSGPEPEGFRGNLLQEVAINSKASTVFLARMLREIYSSDTSLASHYRTWFPGAQITTLTKTSTPPQMVDPVDTNRTYTADDLNFYILYTYTPRTQRSGVFHFTRADLTKPWALSEFYYADAQQVNSSVQRVLNWRITVRTGSLPASTNYVFVPPTNARAIANVKGQSGG